MAGHKLCECGCGEFVKAGNRFIRGHNAKSNHPMLGKKHSVKSRRKMSLSHNDYQSGEGHPMFGRKHTKDTRKRMSKSHKGVPLSKKHRKSLILANKKSWSKLSDEEKAERHAKMWEPFNGNSPMKDRKHTKQSKIKNRETKLKAWKDPEYAKKCLVFNSPNKSEKKLMKILDSMCPKEWMFVGDGTVIIDGKCPDFININGQKKIIELFGEFWHEPKEEDERINFFEQYGYDTLIIWFKELDKVKKLKQKIGAFCFNDNSSACEKGGSRYDRS